MPQGIPFCVLNVAAGKAPMQSSVMEGGIPQKAVDGSTSTFFDASTCTLTEVERAPWWYVNLLEPYMVQLVRIDFGQSCCAKGRTATIVVRVGNNRPDLGVNPICNRFTGVVEEGRPLFLPCNPPMPGAFVSVHFEGPPGVSLSICEAFVYTDQALPIERCPTFRDQPPGSTATYNGKCYIFYNQQPSNFQAALDFCEGRGGSLVDESNPALQGFLSWELWRRHKGDANGQYWLGAVRDRTDTKSWKWINGKPVTVSFWNLPGGNDNCARFDGTKGWLWSDTNCGLKLNYICQHTPTTCGKPEQPPNSTLIAPNFNVGSRIEYACDEGHLLVGPSQRSCLPTGFYSEFPPVCRFLECGMPADVPNGKMMFVNGTRGFQSQVTYDCDLGFIAVGRTTLMCDVDERWNGPPPRCDPIFCEEPSSIRYGGFSLSTNSTVVGTVASYYCVSPRHVLIGVPKLTCRTDGSWDAEVPHCRPRDRKQPVEPEEPTLPTITKPVFTRPRDAPIARRPIRKKPIPRDPTMFERPRPRPSFPPLKKNDGPLDENISGPARFPVSNEIPDSANVQANQAPGADEPPVSSVKTEREARQQQLNLGGIIALGVFGGFVFLAAIITTIVILIRRTLNSRRFRGSSPTSSSTTSSSSCGTSHVTATTGTTSGDGQEKSSLMFAWKDKKAVLAAAENDLKKIKIPHAHIRKEPSASPAASHHRNHHNHQSGSSTDTGSSSHEGEASSSAARSGFRSRLGTSEEVRDGSEMVVSSFTKPEKQRHHHHHHHRHKHRSSGDGHHKDNNKHSRY